MGLNKEGIAMSRRQERMLFALALIFVLVFGVSAGAGAAKFAVTKKMWAAMEKNVKAKATSRKVATLEKEIEDLKGVIENLEPGGGGGGGGGDIDPGLIRDEVEKALKDSKDVQEAKTQAGEAIGLVTDVKASLESSIAALAQFDKKLGVKFKDGAENGLTGPHVIFEDVNVHVRTNGGWPNGNGLGNLIVGMNDKRPTYIRPDKMTEMFPVDTSKAVDPGRTGSNTLVVGNGHGWTGWGGIVTGYSNDLDGGYAIVGGRFNYASAAGVVVGGAANKIFPNQGDTLIAGGVGNTLSRSAPWGVSMFTGANPGEFVAPHGTYSYY
jgi:cell division protein FtsB